MGDVVTFRPAPRRAASDEVMDYRGLMEARHRPPADVVPCPADIQFRRWVRSMDVNRAAWSCLRHLHKGEQDEALRWWHRHRDEVFRVGSKTMKKADLESLWTRYRDAVRARIDEIKAEYRTRAQWELALAARKFYRDPLAPAELDQDTGRDGVA